MSLVFKFEKFPISSKSYFAFFAGYFIIFCRQNVNSLLLASIKVKRTRRQLTQFQNRKRPLKGKAKESQLHGLSRVTWGSRDHHPNKGLARGLIRKETFSSDRTRLFFIRLHKTLARELRQWRRWRWQNVSSKSEFALFQNSSLFFHSVPFVKC